MMRGRKHQKDNLDEDKMKRLILAVILGGALSVPFVFCAHANDKFATPNLHQYYSSLMQPDSQLSCCGPGDAYYADKTTACDPARPDERLNCAFVAIITDQRPDTIMVGDHVIGRSHIPVGTRVPIPKSKTGVRRPPNPTGHNIVFIGVAHFGKNEFIMNVYCWEPNPGI